MGINIFCHRPLESVRLNTHQNIDIFGLPLQFIRNKHNFKILSSMSAFTLTSSVQNGIIKILSLLKLNC